MRPLEGAGWHLRHQGLEKRSFWSERSSDTRSPASPALPPPTLPALSGPSACGCGTDRTGHTGLLQSKNPARPERARPPTPRSGRRPTCSAPPSPSPHGPAPSPPLSRGRLQPLDRPQRSPPPAKTYSVRGCSTARPRAQARQKRWRGVEGPGKTKIQRPPVSGGRFSAFAADRAIAAAPPLSLDEASDCLRQ